MRVSYNDGDELEKHICGLVARADDLSSLSRIGHEEHHVWPVRYHLCPERGNLFRHFDFSGLDVLELGAGMGGASRFVAENAKSFTAVEGTSQRLEALKQRLRDLNNWEAAVCNIDSYETEKRFDVVSLIGVLEYAELYTSPPDGSSPFDWMMRKAESFLKPEGVVLVAIENSNGIKYWAGAPEDHTGQMFDGICGYPLGKTVKTFSRARLLQFFREANLAHVDEFYPWPDYKTPHCVVAKPLVERHPEIAVDMAVDAVMREPIKGVHYFPTSIALYETVPSGLFQEFSNSFLFVGCQSVNSGIRAKLLRPMLEDKECAWHYSLQRSKPVQTVMALPNGPAGPPIVTKRRLSPSGKEEIRHSTSTVTWVPVPESPALTDPKLNHVLRRVAYFEGAEALENEVLAFLRWSLAHWSLDEEGLRCEALDAITQNAVKTADGYRLFDLEWILDKPVPASYFVFRNVFNLAKTMRLVKESPFHNLSDLYMHLSDRLDIEPALDIDMRLESLVQAEINPLVCSEDVFGGIQETMAAPILAASFPRDASIEAFLRRDLVDNPEAHHAIRTLQEDNRRLKEQMSRNCVKIGLALDARLRKVKPIFSLAKQIYKFSATKK